MTLPQNLMLHHAAWKKAALLVVPNNILMKDNREKIIKPAIAGLVILLFLYVSANTFAKPENVALKYIEKFACVIAKGFKQ